MWRGFVMYDRSSGTLPRMAWKLDYLYEASLGRPHHVPFTDRGRQIGYQGV